MALRICCYYFRFHNKKDPVPGPLCLEIQLLHLLLKNLVYLYLATSDLIFRIPCICVIPSLSKAFLSNNKRKIILKNDPVECHTSVSSPVPAYLFVGTKNTTLADCSCCFFFSNARSTYFRISVNQM